MDGTHGHRPWGLVFDAVAHADRIWSEGFWSILALSAGVIFYALAGTRLDLLCTVALLVHRNRSVLASHVPVAIQYVPISLLCLVVVVLLASHLALASRSNDACTWTGPGRPYLIPCRTTHSRLFPEKHSFSYSYLTVGVPVGYEGSANGMLGIDEKPSSRFGGLLQSWYRVRASDHLQRGHDELGLRGKLDRHLRSEGVDPTDFPHAYLVTAARFGGHHFNPVSFWFLYSSHKTLSAVVFEVNNTFDERRSYLVVRDGTAESPHTAPPVMASRVEKDFHVSPFNSRKGSYSVRASDPLGPGMDGWRGLDVTVTLNSSKGHPKLVARLCSEGPAVDPAALGLLGRSTFLARWFWVGFATFPRIFKEAVVLLYRRKLRVWDRPEPLPGTLGRRATSVETGLEACFGKYLEALVRRSAKPLSLKYCTGGLLSATEATFTSSCGGGTHPQHDDQTLKVRILTPAFYSRFVQYVDGLDAMTAEFHDHGTVWVDKPELLPDVFTDTSVTPQSMGFLDLVFAGLVRHMRQRPTRIPPVSTPADPPRAPPKDVNALSSMDAYMSSCGDGQLKRQYQWAATRQLVADCYLMGRVDWLDRVTDIARVGFAWACASSLTQIAREALTK